jgi:hypothetical protein
MKNIYLKILFLYSLAIFSNLEATSKGLISLEDLRTVAQEDLNNPLFQKEGFREFLENSQNVHPQEKIIVSLSAQKLDSSKMIAVNLKLKFENDFFWNLPQTRNPIVYEECLGNFSASKLRRAAGHMGFFEIPKFTKKLASKLMASPVIVKFFPKRKINAAKSESWVFNRGVFNDKGHMNFIQLWLIATYMWSGNPFGFVTDQVDFTNFPHQVLASENLIRLVNYSLGSTYFYLMQMSRSHLKGNSLKDASLMRFLAATGGLFPGPHLVLEIIRRQLSVGEMLAGHNVPKNPRNILNIAGNLLPQISETQDNQQEKAHSHNVKLVFENGECLLEVDSQIVDRFPINKQKELNKWKLEWELYQKLHTSLRVASLFFGQDKKNPSGGNADIQTTTNYILSTIMSAGKAFNKQDYLKFLASPVDGYIGFYQAIFEKFNLMLAYGPYALTKAGYSYQAAEDAHRGQGLFESLTHASSVSLPPVNMFFEMLARYARLKVLMSEKGINLSEQSLKLLIEEGMPRLNSR